jgi:hypothetical protein
VSNPKQLLFVWLLIFGGGWVSLRNLPHFLDLGSASAWEMVGAFGGAVWIVVVPVALWILVRRFRRGLEVAITGDGLILRLPGFSDDVIPWRDIAAAAVKEIPPGHGQVALVKLRGKAKKLEVGGLANVFPDRDAVKRFADEVNARVAAAGGGNETHAADAAARDERESTGA